MMTTYRAYFDTVAEKIASVDFLIGELKLFQCLLTRLEHVLPIKINQMVSRIIPNRCACLREYVVRTQNGNVLFSDET